MDRIDGILAGRLLETFGDWRRLSAHLHLARRGHRPSRARLETAVGARLHGVMLRKGQPTDFVRRHVDFSIADPGDDQIMIAADLELAPGVGWNGIHITVPDGTYPETLRLSLPGRAASAFIEHPDIPPDARLSGLTEIAPTDAFVRVEGVPSMDVPRASRIQILCARVANTLRALRIGVREAGAPKAIPAWSTPMMILMISIDAWTLLVQHPQSRIVVAVIVLTMAMGFVTLLLNLDNRLRYPVMQFRVHVRSGCLAQDDLIDGRRRTP